MARLCAPSRGAVPPAPAVQAPAGAPLYAPRLPIRAWVGPAGLFNDFLPSFLAAGPALPGDFFLAQPPPAVCVGWSLRTPSQNFTAIRTLNGTLGRENDHEERAGDRGGGHRIGMGIDGERSSVA